jgi:hypothetical protein
MPAADYVAAVDEAFQRDYAPRFAELGIVMPVYGYPAGLPGVGEEG